MRNGIKRGIGKLGAEMVSLSRTGSLSRSKPNPTAGDDDDGRMPVKPSAKALGKRRADPPPEEGGLFERFDITVELIYGLSI